MRGWLSGVALLSCLGSIDVTSAHGGDLADAFRTPAIAQLGLAPLGTALATTVAASYPVASASSSTIWEYNPALDTLERRTGLAGPLLGERARTIGRGKLNLGLAYSHIRFATINGDELDSLTSRRTVSGQIIFVPVPGGVTLRDGRFTTILPAKVSADLDVAAHQLAASVTYGVTPRLDVNLTVPLVHTSLDLAADGLAPDPRFPTFALPGERTLPVHAASDAEASGVGDLRLRGKYLVHRGAPADVALGLGLALPSGDEEDFAGAGTTRVEPVLILSRVVAARFEPFLDVGVECNADDVGRSVVGWAVGSTARVVGELTAAVTFLGRHELGAQADEIPVPFFFQIERNDVYDAAVGLRWRFAERGIVSANVVLPLNRDGLRADAVPMLDVEYAF